MAPALWISVDQRYRVVTDQRRRRSLKHAELSYEDDAGSARATGGIRCDVVRLPTRPATAEISSRLAIYYCAVNRPAGNSAYPKTTSGIAAVVRRVIRLGRVAIERVFADATRYR
jgi:hypothetical protein